ncbi:19408_t:CDS:2 [Rhizophagus irregularis]|nr:19408_t:CDS:2 [Rhizophagus irregularis]
MSRFRHACHIHDKKLIQTPPFPSSFLFTLPYWSKFSQHVVHSDLLDSSMWMATKEYAVVIPPFSYNLTMSTTDYSIVLSFTGSIQKVVLNPSSVVTSNLITDKPNSGPFVSLNCPTINYQDFKTLGFILQKYLRDAIQSVITKSASSSTFSHLWNSDTRFFFKLGHIKPCDILFLLDVCAPWFDSHTYPAASDF